MLTTTNNNESNNYSMLSSMSKDLMKKGDIKQRCTAACFGLVPISQDCYFCPKCDPGHKVHLCESCFDDCHFVVQHEVRELDFYSSFFSFSILLWIFGIYYVFIQKFLL